MSLDITTTFEPDGRDGFGQYVIPPGNTFIFPFTIPLMGQVVITLQHTKLGTQDLSIVAWVTREPLDQAVLDIGFGHLRLSRVEQKFTIYDEFLRQNDDDPRSFLASGVTHYVNVKNLQNSMNGFDLLFD